MKQERIEPARNESPQEPVPPAREETRAATVAAPAPATSQPAADNDGNPGENHPRLDPTRYGDWEKNGRCIDF